MMKKLMMCLVLVVLLVGSVSALEFDNGLKYEQNDLKVVVENGYWFGIGDWFGFNTELGTAELKSHSSVDEVLKFGFGKEEVVMYYDFEGWELYQNGLGQVTFTDIRTGKEIQKDYYFVINTSRIETLDNYSSVLINTNGTKRYETKFMGTYEKEVFYWERLNNTDIPNNNVRIGLKTYVDKGDYIDAVWTIAGKEINRHASWSASLKVGVIAYYDFEQTGTTLTDLTGNQDGSLVAPITTGITGALGDAWNFTGGFVNLTGLTSSTGVLSFSFWVNTADQSDPDNFFFDSAGGRIAIISDAAPTGNNMGKFDGSYGNFGVAQTFNSWINYIYISNATGWFLFVNGTQQPTTFASAGNDIGGITELSGLSQEHFGGMDEVAIWNRSISQAEVNEVQLLNPFNPPSPTLTLNSPIDFFNTTNNTIIFNGTATDDVDVGNVTLYITGLFNETNSSPINNTPTIFTKFLADGEYNWTYEACNDQNSCTNKTRTLTINTTPNIEYVSPTPINTFNSTEANLTINISLTEDFFLNLTIDLYIVNGALNRTITFTNSTREVNFQGLEDATFSYNVTVFTTTGQSNSTETRNISIDTTIPNITLTGPPLTIDSHTLNTNLTVNWTVVEANPDTCILEYENVNVTVTCGDLTTEINTTNSENRTIIIYINDTFGNVGSDSRTWAYNFIETGSEFTTNVFETKNYSFAINVTTTQSVSSFTAFLNHNGTIHSADSVCTGGDCEISTIIDIPLLNFGQTSENKTFFWQLSIFNGTGTSNINTSVGTQNVTAINFEICGTTPQAVNFTISKESDRSLLPSNFDSTFESYLGTGSVTKISNFSGSGTNHYEFCIDQNETFIVTSQIDLSSDGFSSRRYDFVQDRFINVSVDRELFLLNSTASSTIIIEVKDQGLIPLENIIVNISRFYPGIGQFIQVENQITDEFGQIVAKLVENDAKYRFNFFSGDGRLLKTSEDITIACRSLICIIPFVIEDTTDEFERFDNLTTYTSTLAFDNTTNVFTFTWADQRGESPVTTRLEVTRYKLNGSSVVCNVSSTSILSTLNCDVGGERASYKAQSFRTTTDDIRRRISILNVRVNDVVQTYGLEGLLWVFLLLFTMIGIGAFNPTVGASLYGSGFLIMGILGIISMPPEVFFANTILVIIFIWAVNKSK